jgi:uncharacterized protein YciI
MLKKIQFILFLLTVSISWSQEKNMTISPQFDSELALKLKADDYGMKKYVMAFLKSGPNKSSNNEERTQLQRAHLDNIIRMSNEGTLVLAGPFLDNGDLRGIYIFNVETVEEAIKLTETDPMILKGVLIMEMHPWYGSATLQMIGSLHKKAAKLNP